MYGGGKKRPVQQLQRLQPLKRGQYSNYSDYSHYSEGKSHLRQIIYLRQSESGQCTASVACLRASVATYRCTAAEREVNMPLQRRKEPPVTSQIIQSGQGTDSVACLRASVMSYKCTAAEKKRSTSSVAGRATCDLTDASARLKVA